MAQKKFDQEVVRKIFVKMVENYLTASEISAEIASAIAEVVADAPSSYDTLGEIADWIESHEVIIEDNTEAIDALAEMIGTLPEGSSTVIEYIQTIVSDNYDELYDKVEDDIQKVNDRIDEILVEGGAGEFNIINTVQQNGVDLDVTNKTVNVIVPTELSELENDVGYITTDGTPDIGFLDDAMYVGSEKSKFWYMEETNSICFSENAGLTYDESTKSLCYADDSDDFGYTESSETIYFSGVEVSADGGYFSEVIDLDSGETRLVYDAAAHESIDSLESGLDELNETVSEHLAQAGLIYDAETETISMQI